MFYWEYRVGRGLCWQIEGLSFTRLVGDGNGDGANILRVGRAVKGWGYGGRGNRRLWLVLINTEGGMHMQYL